MSRSPGDRLAVRSLVNGVPDELISVRDRGLGYGDGVFTTIRFKNDRGDAPLIKQHIDSLRDYCACIGLPNEAVDSIWQEGRNVTGGMHAGAIVKVILTRGMGERGYAPPAKPRVMRIVSAFEPPVIDPAIYRDGVAVRICDLRLGDQPRLAGAKTLNRLEQVLARAEWNDPAIHEGLMLDQQGHVIDGTMSNLFAVIDGRIVTPRLDRCGVRGVGRRVVFQGFFDDIDERDVLLDEWMQASEIFLSSSVRGILPVRAIGDKVFAPGPVTRAVQAFWRDLGFPMEKA